MKTRKLKTIAKQGILFGMFPLLFAGCEKDLKAEYEEEKKAFEVREEARIASEKAFVDKLSNYSLFKPETPEAIAEKERTQIKADIWCEACDRKRALIEQIKPGNPDYARLMDTEDCVLIEQFEAEIRKERGLPEA